MLWPEGAPRPDTALFDCDGARGGAGEGGTGRGATEIFAAMGTTVLLRHYRRGGMVRHVSGDRYIWLGLRRSRPWRELRALTHLAARGLPVPPPVAARVVRPHPVAPWYRGDLVTGYLAGTRTLAQTLRGAPLGPSGWRAVGATLARLHAAGVDHADLNAHNLLLDDRGTVYVIDFDRARLRRASGRWCGANLARLRRSLDKLAREREPIAFEPPDWGHLLAGYGR